MAGPKLEEVRQIMRRNHMPLFTRPVTNNQRSDLSCEQWCNSIE